MKIFLQKLKNILLFDTSSIRSLKNVRAQILSDNRKFAMIWSLAQLFYATYSFIMSFFKSSYEQCRNVYIAAAVISIVAFLIAQLLAKKIQPLVYLSMLLNYIALFGSGMFIALIILRNGGMTIMVFAAVLIVPVLFINNTLLNIMTATINIVVSIIVLNSGLTEEVSRWCLTNLVIFSSMGIILGHFINKSRFERYVFAESAVQLAESNAKLAELQTRYAYYDQMTELKNRRAYSEQMDALYKNLPDNCCVIEIDINGLKRTNDMFGHDAGDELIIGTAKCLKKSFAGIDDVYRIGGDEFCVVMTAADKKDVEDRLSVLENECAEFEGKYIHGFSVSYGYSTTKEFSDIDLMMKEADKKMYAYKNRYYENIGWATNDDK